MAYDGIYPYIRTRLQDSIEGIEDSEFDAEIASALRRLLAPFGLAYDDLSDVDVAWVDEAAGLTVAARLLGPYSTGGAGSALTMEQTETTKRQFETGIEARWLQEAREAMSHVSFNTIPASGVRFGANGYRRQHPGDDGDA